jgi:serine/threonine protein phosphatase PrpC
MVGHTCTNDAPVEMLLALPPAVLSAKKGDTVVVIRSAGKSDVGKVREKNEDSLLVNDALGLYVVADGMGGHVGGQRASSLAVQTIDAAIVSHQGVIAQAIADEPVEGTTLSQVLSDAVRAACAAIFDTAQSDTSLQGMGTTVTAMLLYSGRAIVAHVGDSRCYLHRDEQIMQITDDHSLVNEQIKAGLISREQARTSRLKNIITRSVGFERDVAVDTFTLPVSSGDKFLLCSDGLINLVEDAEIGRCLVEETLDVAASKLIDLANLRGGDDNITVVCLEAVGGAATP